MKKIEHFTLEHLRHALESNDTMMADNYISRHLAIASEVAPTIVREQFMDDPVLLDEMRVLILKRGWVEVVVNLVPRRFEAGQLIFLAQNGILQFQRIAADALGLGLSMSDELFALAMGGNVPKSFDGHLRDFSFALSPPDMAFLTELHDLLRRYAQQERHSSHALLRLIAAFMHHIDHLHQALEASSPVALTHRQKLFADFMQLVAQHAARQHSVEFYASRLCLSPRYVSTLVRQASGKTAKQWIDDAMIARIKVDLRHTDKQVAQISDEMNFPNTSFFCKYFKRLTGMTPSHYRNQQ